MADFSEVAELLHIFKGTHEHGEQFKHIRDAALARLKAINEEHAPKNDEPAVEEPPVEDEPKQVDTNAAIETQRRV